MKRSKNNYCIIRKNARGVLSVKAGPACHFSYDHTRAVYFPEAHAERIAAALSRSYPGYDFFIDTAEALPRYQLG